jgi:hypothetical protein
MSVFLATPRGDRAAQALFIIHRRAFAVKVIFAGLMTSMVVETFTVHQWQ